MAIAASVAANAGTVSTSAPARCRTGWGKEYKGYVRTSAQKYARDRRSRHRLKLSLKPVLRNHVIAKLYEGWSPQ